MKGALLREARRRFTAHKIRCQEEWYLFKDGWGIAGPIRWEEARERLTFVRAEFVLRRLGWEGEIPTSGSLRKRVRQCVRLPAGRPRATLTSAEVEAALAAAGGVRRAAARKLGVDPKTLRRWLRENK